MPSPPTPSPAAPPQLDLFADSRDVMLRNDVIEALLRDDGVAAATAIERLHAAYPDDAALADAPALLTELQALSAPPLADLDAACAAVADLQDRLAPAAQRVLGASASAGWLQRARARLARRAAALPWRADRAQGHPAGLWLQARDWQAADEAVQRIESWRRIPQPLAWMAQAVWHLHGPDASWPLLAELAWLAPERFVALARLLPDRMLPKLTCGFEGDLDAAASPAGWAWFPAWALTEQPLLAGAMSGAEATRGTDPEQAWQLVQALLRLEREGRHHEVIAHRQRLRALNTELFACYMRTRS